jgi:PEP-CTERM motif-containing protein
LKIRIASLTILCLALAASPAMAQTYYNNGPINGTTDAWTINFGYIVSDTFTLPFNTTVNQVQFGVWEFPGDTMSTVDWTITTTENGTGVGVTSNVSDTYISTNQYGYNIDLISFNTGGVPLLFGTTYWLNLYNATVPSGDPVYWDENSGPSSASESAVGTIPSEAFTVCGAQGCGVGTTPEPSSIMLFGSGILGLAGLLRRKLF